MPLDLEEIKDFTSLPKDVKEAIKNLETKKDLRVFKSEPMFGGKNPDFIVKAGKCKKLTSDGITCMDSYVYNGDAPEFSEYGSVTFSSDFKKRVG